MPIIRRAVSLRGLSSAYFSQLPPLSALWQSVQVSPREAEKNPMVAMNWSTGMPLSTRMFLKVCSAADVFCCGGACPLANATLSRPALMFPILLNTTELYMRGRHLPKNRYHRRRILQTLAARGDGGEKRN